MLEYDWGNQATILLSGEEPNPDSDQTRQVFDHYDQSLPAGNLFPPANPFSFHQHQPDPSPHMLDSLYPLPPPGPGPTLFSSGETFRLSAPKTEEFLYSGSTEFPARIGLNLGGRTYFASSEDDFVNRLYRRSRPAEPNLPRCQAEGCAADLSNAKHYHRRHKVCEFHSKASTVVAAGVTQRFCQQCSRFHLLVEFDQGKRSCRKRLADHNRRRRKSQPQPLAQIETTSKSSSESGGTAHSSSDTMIISRPQIPLDCFGSRLPANFPPFSERIWEQEEK